MKGARARALLFFAGLIFIIWGMAPRQSVPASAAPGLLITETATTEPPSPTPSPTRTPAGQIDPTSTPTVTPTNTPVAPPSATPEAPPPDDDDDDPTPTNTPEPSATASPSPVAATPAPGPDPSVTKSVSPSTATVGDTVVYTILVSNQGGAPATGVTVEDTLPAFLALVDVQATRGTVTSSGRSVRVEIGDLAAGETVEVRVSARVIAAAAAPDNRNLATVSSSTPDDNPGNNQSSVPLDAGAPAALPTTDEGPQLPLLAVAVGLALVAGSVLVRGSARRRPGR